MKKFSIPVCWSMGGNVVVEAENLEQAIKFAEDAALPEDGVYIDYSFFVDVDNTMDYEID